MNRRRPIPSYLLLAVACLFVLLLTWWNGAPIAHANEISVSASCTITQAIRAANIDSAVGGCPGGSGADTLILEAGRTYLLTASDNSFGGLGDNGLPPITSTITISGSGVTGATIARDPSLACPGGGGGSDFRIFYVDGLGGASGVLTLQNVRVRNGCVAGNGGALYNFAGSVVMDNSQIDDNRAGEDGGALYNDGGSMTLLNSQILSNRAGKKGGGLHSLGGSMTVTSSHILFNRAGESGGGLFNFGGEVLIGNSEIRANIAITNIDDGSFYGGGGIHSDGGIMSVQSSQILSNTAGEYGGGLYNIYGMLTIQSSHILSNTAGEVGGGLFNLYGTATIQSSYIVSNTAANYAGGASNFGIGAVMRILEQSIVADNLSILGIGGLYNDEFGALTVTDSRVVSNTGGGFAGGLLNKNATAVIQNSHIVANRVSQDGGGIYNFDNAFMTISQDSIIADNRAGERGGGLTNTGTLTVTSSHILSNTANNGGGLFNYGSMLIRNSHILANSANDNGGGLYQASGALHMSNSDVTANLAGLLGGGIFLTNTVGGGSVLSVTLSRLLHNEALAVAEVGGALYQTAGSSALTQSCIVGNRATALFNLTGDTVARQNWWGADDGPSGAGPGSGDTVGNRVDFSAFQTAPILGCSDVDVAIFADDADKNEGDSGATPFTFTVTRSGETSSSTQVDYAVIVQGANPVDGADFVGGVLPTGTINFAPGQSSQPVTILVQGDATVEPDEDLRLLLANPSSGATLITPMAEGAIRNDDGISGALPTLAIAATDADKAEGNSGSTPFTFTVTRSGDTSGNTTVNYAVTGRGGNPATAADFAGGTLPSGKLTFTAGQTNKTITVNVQGDSTPENDEGLRVTLSNAGGGQIVTGSANGTIRNDDSPSAPPVAEMTVTNTPSKATAAVGVTVTYTVRVVNTGNVTLTVSALDDRLGAIPLTPMVLPPDTVATGRLPYTVQSGDLPGPLVNTVTVSGAPLGGNPIQRQADASVTLTATPNGAQPGISLPLIARP